MSSSVLFSLLLFMVPVATGSAFAAVDEKLRPQSAPIVFRDSVRSGQPCAYCPELVVLPTGNFLMGAFPWDGHSDEHGPGNRPFDVTLDAVIAMSVFEIKRLEFNAFLDANPGYRLQHRCAGMVGGVFNSDIVAGWVSPGFQQSPQEPVVCVGWGDAEAYVRWLSQLTGARYRLPTEAEWEYAAKGGTITRYWWGDRIGDGHANCRDERCDRHFVHTAPPLAMRPNRFGLYHMLGNVWEWVADCYDAAAYRRHQTRYPAAVGGAPRCQRVIRGGSWAEGVWSLRATNREGWLPHRPLNDIGFRIVREGRDISL